MVVDEFTCKFHFSKMYEINKYMNIDNDIKLAINQCKKYKKGRIFSYTFKYKINDLLPMLSINKDDGNFRVYWNQNSPNIELVGINQACSINMENCDNIIDFNNKIETVLETMISIPDNIDISPKFIGGHAFSFESNKTNIWGNFPRGKYVLPECVATVTDEGSWITISKKINYKDNYVAISKSFKNIFDKCRKLLDIKLPRVKYHELIDITDFPVKNDYINSIASVIKNIKSHKVKKVVMSRYKRAYIKQDLCEVSILQTLCSSYPDCTNYFFSFPNEGIFFGSTPERLLNKNKKILITEALAGTMKRGATENEDCLFEKKLSGSEKNQDEHQFVIDEIISKLAPKSKLICVSNHPEVVKLKNVQHLKSIIKTEVKNDISLLELVDILHPTPAVAGTPIQSALDYINKNETYDRGWYSGPIGWLDSNGNGDIFVGLRSSLYKNNYIYMFSGSGIVSQSSPEEEWEETEMKLQPILTALCGE